MEHCTATSFPHLTHFILCNISILYDQWNKASGSLIWVFYLLYLFILDHVNFSKIRPRVQRRMFPPSTLRRGKNRPKGVSLSFLAYAFFCCLCVDSWVATFRHFTPGAISEVLDGLLLSTIALVAFPAKGFRLAKSQACKPEQRCNQHLLQTYNKCMQTKSVAG